MDFALSAGVGGLFGVSAEAVQDGQVVGAEDEVDDVFFWDVVGVADDEVGHQVFAQEPPGIVVADAEHGTEFREGHHIRVGTETLFIILSCHNRFSFFGCVCGAHCAPLQSGCIPDGIRSDKMNCVFLSSSSLCLGSGQ